MRLIADRAFRHAGKELAVGDAFDANNRDGRVLVALNRAHLAEGDDPPAKASPKKEAPATKRVAKKAAKKRTYKRRDMKAEG